MYAATIVGTFDRRLRPEAPRSNARRARHFIDNGKAGRAGTPAPKTPPGKSLLQNIGDVAGGAYRDINAARTSAARDPVGALGNVLGGPQRFIAGTMAEDTKHKVPQGLGTGTYPNYPAQVLGELGGGVYGAFHPNDPSVENLAEQAYGVNKLKTNKTDLGSRLRNAGVDMGFQTVTDPLTYVGGKLAEVGVHVAKPVLAAAVRGVGPLGKYVTEVRAALSDPALAPAIGKVTHAVRTATAPLRGGVNATKDLLFMNPLASRRRQRGGEQLSHEWRSDGSEGFVVWIARGTASLRRCLEGDGSGGIHAGTARRSVAVGSGWLDERAR